jgi:hypothetical protein
LPQTDLDEAYWMSCCSLITVVAYGAAGQTNTFLLAGTVEEDKRFEVLTITIAG